MTLCFSGKRRHHSRSVCQFAIEAQNGSATGDVKPALFALGKTTQAYVACCAGYKLK